MQLCKNSQLNLTDSFRFKKIELELWDSSLFINGELGWEVHWLSERFDVKFQSDFWCFKAQNIVRIILLGSQIVGRAFAKALKNEFQRNYGVSIVTQSERVLIRPFFPFQMPVSLKKLAVKATRLSKQPDWPESHSK